MNSNHEFALVVLTDKANWVSDTHTASFMYCYLRICFMQYCDFNKNPELVCDAIKSIEAMEESYDSFGKLLVAFISLNASDFTDTASLYSLM